MSEIDLGIAEKNILDPYWRINSLYSIVDKRGNQIPFRLNWAQQRLYRDMHYCNVILKARQLGVSTFVCLLFLDRCLFNSNLTAGVIAHTKEDAEFLFKRIKFAYDNLPDLIRSHRTATNDSARELVFNNGSSLRVGTSMRGQTLQYLHISEFGKICSKYRDKAEEIISGSLNTLAPGQYVFIESTAEGKEGYFHEICKQAQANLDSGKELSKLDFQFFFFPWWGEHSYRIGSPVSISEGMHEYFLSLKSLGIYLDPEQIYWYAAHAAVQGIENMRKEFPSLPAEAWEQSTEGCYYSRQITQARLEKRIGFVPWDESLPTVSAWDLGYNDSNAIIFVQVYGKEIRIIDYVEGSGESLSHWLGVVKSKPYTYEKHLAPHDVMVHEYTSGMTRQASARKMGVNLIPVPKVDLIPGIDQARLILNRCFFDEVKCVQLIQSLENYKKEWDDRAACWRSHPRHDWSSHAADAFRVLATGLSMITGQKSQVDLERAALESQRDQSGLLPGHFLYSNPQKAPAVNARTLGHASTQAARSGRAEHPGPKLVQTTDTWDLARSFPGQPQKQNRRESEF
jgi:hypothetical protein